MLGPALAHTPRGRAQGCRQHDAGAAELRGCLRECLRDCPAATRRRRVLLAAWLLAPAVALSAARPMPGSFEAGAQAEPEWSTSELLVLQQGALDAMPLSGLAAATPRTPDGNDQPSGPIDALLRTVEVAEPESSTLMLAGLALVGAYMRWRRRP